VSVTDRCNLRCVYCTPESNFEELPHEEILAYEEIERVVRAGARFGITKARLTGGEPLIRRDILHLVRMIRGISGIRELVMTTNGVLLSRMAAELKSAGLDRINISIDSLDGEKFSRITRRGSLDKVLEGLEAARGIGFRVKINVVLMRGVNDDEIEDYVRFAAEKGLEVRFIEKMPLGQPPTDNGELLVGADEIEKRIAQVAELVPVSTEPSGPATSRFRIAGGRGIIGIIPTVTRPFCATCNRLRLTADGRLRACLVDSPSVNVKSILRNAGGEDALVKAFRQAAVMKPRMRGDYRAQAMRMVGG
jgi:cyclic pyranopterin phosphate synthase